MLGCDTREVSDELPHTRPTSHRRVPPCPLELLHYALPADHLTSTHAAGAARGQGSPAARAERRRRAQVRGQAQDGAAAAAVLRLRKARPQGAAPPEPRRTDGGGRRVRAGALRRRGVSLVPQRASRDVAQRPLHSRTSSENCIHQWDRGFGDGCNRRMHMHRVLQIRWSAGVKAQPATAGSVSLASKHALAGGHTCMVCSS